MPAHWPHSPTEVCAFEPSTNASATSPETIFIMNELVLEIGVARDT